MELLGEWSHNGRIRYTRPNIGRPMARKKYTIRKYKYKTQITVIGFYDTISMSLCFGFKIRRYKHKWVLFFMHPGGVRDNTPIDVKGYKEIIQVVKSQTRQFN